MTDQRKEHEEELRAIFVQLCVQAASVIESEKLEIKNWCTNEKHLGDKASESSACLANAHGGIVLLGIEDDDIGRRKFSKCPYPNVTTEWIVQRIQDSTVPPVQISVMDASSLLQEISPTSGVNCFAVFVSKTRKIGGHQTVGGNSKIRSGKDCRPYYVAAEDDRSKAPVVFATKEDLSLSSINWGMQKHKKKFEMTKDTWESEFDFLVHIGLLEEDVDDGDSALNYRITLV